MYIYRKLNICNMKTSEYLWIKGQLAVFLIKDLLIGIGIFAIASASIYALFWFFDLNSDLLTFLYVLTSGAYIVINSAIVLHKHDAKVKKLLEFYNSNYPADESIKELGIIN